MPRAFVSLVAAVALTSATACGKTSSTTVAGPSPAKCQLTATNSTPSFSASGGRGAIVVQAARECAWAAAAQASWVAVLPPSEGQGDSTVNYIVQANPSGLPRRGTVNVAGQLVEVGQQGAPCQFELDRPGVQVGALAGMVEVSVRGPAGCAWTAASEAPWITVAQGGQGAGPGQVVLSLAQNTGATRTGTVLVAGIRFQVTQGSTLDPPPPPPPGCTYTLLPTSAQIAASGGVGAVSLTTAAECPWVAISDQPWLTVTSATSGSGSAEIAYRVAANDTGAPRTGVITVGNAIFAVDQVAAAAPPPGCTFTVTPSDTITAGAAGATGIISVSTADSCAWSATASDPWIDLSTSGASGPGQVAYTIEPNMLPTERTGTMTVAGTTIAVQQNGGEEITVSGVAENVAGSCPVRTFTLDGRIVITNAATQYRNGSCGKLKSGESINVRGTLTQEGTVDAFEVEFAR